MAIRTMFTAFDYEFSTPSKRSELGVILNLYMVVKSHFLRIGDTWVGNFVITFLTLYSVYRGCCYIPRWCTRKGKNDGWPNFSKYFVFYPKFCKILDRFSYNLITYNYSIFDSNILPLNYSSDIFWYITKICSSRKKLLSSQILLYNTRKEKEFGRFRFYFLKHNFDRNLLYLLAFNRMKKKVRKTNTFVLLSI